MVTEHLGNPGRVSSRHLEHEGAPLPQDVDGSARHRLGGADPDERLTRLPVANLGLEPVDLLRQHVRRVGDDEVPATVRKAAVEIPLAQVDGDARSRHVRTGHLERPRRGVDASHLRTGVLVGEREGDRAASRTDIEDAGRGDAGEPCEAPLDHDLGLGTRDEHAPVDREREPAEAPLAEHVRQRLAGLAARDQPLELLLLGARELAFVLERELRARTADHVRHENLRVDLRRLAPGLRQALAGFAERPRGLHAEAAASAWRCSSARSASVSSPMSPSSTWSRRCSVSLMR